MESYHVKGSEIFFWYQIIKIITCEGKKMNRTFESATSIFLRNYHLTPSMFCLIFFLLQLFDSDFFLSLAEIMHPILFWVGQEHFPSIQRKQGNRSKCYAASVVMCALCCNTKKHISNIRFYGPPLSCVVFQPTLLNLSTSIILNYLLAFILISPGCFTNGLALKDVT